MNAEIYWNKAIVRTVYQRCCHCADDSLETEQMKSFNDVNGLQEASLRFSLTLPAFLLAVFLSCVSQQTSSARRALLVRT